VRYAELTWQGAPSALADRWLVLPIGSVEQHGPHLPLGVDSCLAEAFANQIADRLSGMVAPTLPYGARSLPNSGGGHVYPGTIHLSGEALLAVYRDLIAGFVRAGARRLLVLNGHWENEGLLLEALDGCRERGTLANAEIVALSWWSVVHEPDMRELFGDFRGWHVEHAGQAETALMLALQPNAVQLKAAVDHHGHIPAGIYRHPTPPKWNGTDGVLCPTTHATSAQGERLAELVIDRIVSLLLGS
jgi:creatinine amidohydrolase